MFKSLIKIVIAMVNLHCLEWGLDGTSCSMGVVFDFLDFQSCVVWFYTCTMKRGAHASMSATLRHGLNPLSSPLYNTHNSCLVLIYMCGRVHGRILCCCAKHKACVMRNYNNLDLNLSCLTWEDLSVSTSCSDLNWSLSFHLCFLTWSRAHRYSMHSNNFFRKCHCFSKTLCIHNDVSLRSPSQ